MAHRKWTAEEDDLLTALVQEDNPDNISAGIREATNRLDRTFSACLNRYYGVIINPNHPGYRGTGYVLMAKKHSLINAKNRSVNHHVKEHNSSIWTKIKKLLKLG
jgi:hypothetical protein